MLYQPSITLAPWNSVPSWLCWPWKDRSVIKHAYWSSRGSGFGSQHLITSYNFLKNIFFLKIVTWLVKSKINMVNERNFQSLDHSRRALVVKCAVWHQGELLINASCKHGSFGCNLPIFWEYFFHVVVPEDSESCRWSDQWQSTNEHNLSSLSHFLGFTLSSIVQCLHHPLSDSSFYYIHLPKQQEKISLGHTFWL